MILLKKKNKFKSQIVSNSKKILKYLHIGINIPIWPEFHKYILHDLEYFQAKSIILIENKKTVGHVLIYNVEKRILYFGFFGVVNNDEIKIKFLINKLLEYARANNFKLIRGPINIPSVIYGFGFLKEGGKEDLFVSKPVNPPIYQKLFLTSGFYIKFEEYTWEGPFLRVNPRKIKKYDFSEYEYFSPKNWVELMELKNTFLAINARNFPLASKITPNIKNLFDNYAEFVVKYGGYHMFFFLRYKITGEIIGCGCNLPNPFRKNAKGKYDSFIAYSYAIDLEYRGKGLIVLMGGENSLIGWKKKFRYGSVLTGTQKKKGENVIESLVGLKKARTHLILEFKL